MSGIVLSAAVRQNLLSLQSTADLLSTTQNRLATGKKVNTALDNPTNYFTAAGLDSRASDINNLLDGISNGVQIIQAANTGISSIQKLIDNAKSVASQALQTTVAYSPKSNVTSAIVPGATSADLRGAPTNATVTGATIHNDDTTGGSIQTVTGATRLVGTAGAGSNNLSTAITNGSILTVNGKTITFSTSQTTKTTDGNGNVTIGIGAGSLLTVQDVIDSIDTITGTTTPSTISSNAPANGSKLVLSSGTASDLTIAGSGNVLTALGLTAGTTTRTPGPLNGLTLTIAATGVGGVNTTIVFGDGTSGTVRSLADLNAKLAANNLQATVDSTGRINIATTNDAASFTLGAIAGTAAGAGQPFNGLVGSPPIADPVAQAARANLVNQYNTIVNQIDKTAQDASYNGVNLLNGDTLKLVFNETGKSTLTVPGTSMSASSLGLPTLVSGLDFLDNGGTNRVLTALNAASSSLRGQASALGANLSIVQIRQEFAKNLINVLQTGSSNLTLADTNEEAANSQALSTRQSIAVSALALANQSQQSVLQLLR